MAIDHFIKHKWARERTDWNFNVLFNDQQQVAELARQYAPLIKHPGLYKPIPEQWLHATVLRVGFLEDFTEAQMLAVVEMLEPKLASMKMPQLMLGQWGLWNGGPFLHITPKRQLQEMFGYLRSSLAAVVGRGCLPVKLRWLPVRLQFIPHVTLAYPKTHNDKRGLCKQLQSRPINGVRIRADKLSLIKQYVENDYYAWEILKELPIGQVE